MSNEDGLPRLAVNFDPALVRMLREVRYFLQQPNLPIAIPAAALKVGHPAELICPCRCNAVPKTLHPRCSMQVHERADSFRAQVDVLDIIAHMYNDIYRTLLPVEKPLIQMRLDALDAALQTGLTVRAALSCIQHGCPRMPGCQGGVMPTSQKLTWNSYNVDASIADTLTLVRGAQDVLAMVKTNAQRAQQLAAQWSLHVLFERKDAQAVGFAELQAAFRASYGARSAVIREGGREIAQILAESLRTLNMGRANSAWLAFVDYIAATVIQGLKDTAQASLRHLLSMVCRATCVHFQAT